MPLYELQNNIGEQFAHEVHAWIDALSYVTVQGVSQHGNGPWELACVETLAAQQQSDVQTWLDAYLPQPAGVEPADLAKVKAEIASDPASIGYSGMSDTDAAAAMMATTQTKTLPIPSTELLAWAAGISEGETTPRWDKIEDAVANPPNASLQIRAIARAALKMIDRDNTFLDISLPDRAAMVGALVQTDVLSAADYAALLLLANRPASRAELIGAGVVGRRDVAMARAR